MTQKAARSPAPCVLCVLWPRNMQPPYLWVCQTPSPDSRWTEREHEDRITSCSGTEPKLVLMPMLQVVDGWWSPQARERCVCCQCWQKSFKRRFMKNSQSQDPTRSFSCWMVWHQPIKICIINKLRRDVWNHQKKVKTPQVRCSFSEWLLLCENVTAAERS